MENSFLSTVVSYTVLEKVTVGINININIILPISVSYSRNREVLWTDLFDIYQLILSTDISTKFILQV